MRDVLFAGLVAPALLVSAAQAADLPRRAYAPAPVTAYAPAPFSWTGFYAGLNAGYSWGSLGDLGDASFGKPRGALVGGTLGYNYQMNQFLVGLEGDLNWTGMKSTRSAPGGAAPIYYTASMPWLATARLRLGFAVERALVYATGGYAGASVKTRYSHALTPAVADSGSVFAHGWTLGAGIEYAFTNSISLKAEYLHVNLGRDRVFGGIYATQANASASIVRAGLNYHF